MASNGRFMVFYGKILNGLVSSFLAVMDPNSFCRVLYIESLHSNDQYKTYYFFSLFYIVHEWTFSELPDTFCLAILCTPESSARRDVFFRLFCLVVQVSLLDAARSEYKPVRIAEQSEGPRGVCWRNQQSPLEAPQSSAIRTGSRSFFSDESSYGPVKWRFRPRWVRRISPDLLHLDAGARNSHGAHSANSPRAPTLF